MNTANQKFVRANGSYDVSAALEHGALLQRRQQRVSCHLLSRAVIDIARRLWSSANVEAALVDNSKTRAR